MFMLLSEEATGNPHGPYRRPGSGGHHLGDPWFRLSTVAASGLTIWTSTYGLEPVLCNRLLFEPSGWAQTVHVFTQRFT